ncbi:MAG: hypothetical protein U9N34_06590 [Candidatus Cloacimonadota bacterium]|nr:hypothetical protein [Candidatus Cloacimonadota bacterium]
MNKYLLILILIISGCSNSRLKTARRLRDREKYAGSIEFYDLFLKYEDNGALKTKAIIERSSCYYNLGEIAMQKENWELAKRFFYLANSEVADEKLDNCYYKLSELSLEKGDNVQAKSYNQFILDNLKTSEFKPRILFKRIEEHISNNDDRFAWNIYKLLFDEYPQDRYTSEAQKSIDPFVPKYIENAKTNLSKIQAIEYLSNISKYPTSSQKNILKEIATLHIDFAEQMIEEENYIEADNHFTKAIKFNAAKKSFVDNRLNEICTLFIEKGQQLLDERKVEQAIKNFEITYKIIPNFETAAKLIKQALQKQKNMKDAAAHFQNARDLEIRNEYTQALNLYQKSYKLDKLNKTSLKIELIKNLIEIKKSPKKFAKEIFFSHKNGELRKKVEQFESLVLDDYSKNTKKSGWKFLLSYGQYSFEARYDIITLENSYYFAWLINLKTRKISPMNKDTKQLENDKL